MCLRINGPLATTSLGTLSPRWGLSGNDRSGYSKTILIRGSLAKRSGELDRFTTAIGGHSAIECCSIFEERIPCLCSHLEASHMRVAGWLFCRE